MKQNKTKLIQNPKKTLRFALVGCGRIAKKHIEAIHQLPNVKIVSVCDTNEKRAKSASRYIQELRDAKTKQEEEIAGNEYMERMRK